MAQSWPWSSQIADEKTEDVGERTITHKSAPLREKCPNTEFFLVCIFSPNTGKYGPDKTPYLDTFHAVHLSHMRIQNPVKHL